MRPIFSDLAFVDISQVKKTIFGRVMRLVHISRYFARKKDLFKCFAPSQLYSPAFQKGKSFRPLNLWTYPSAK